MSNVCSIPPQVSNAADQSVQPPAHRGRRLGAYLLLIILVAVAAWRGVTPGDPVKAKSPADFSLERAATMLKVVLGDNLPSPTGTAANSARRARIVAQLTQLGYKAETTTAFACSPQGTCAQVVNVTAELPGQLARPYVLVSAHYDSVAAGPGTADDAAGVASLLEIARALQVEGPHRYPVLLLFDDGEELGELGARAFVEHDPRAASIRWAVNLEARGASGPSLMFETSEHNQPLIEAYAAVPHPVTNSLLYEVYKRLPNDTDFTIFKSHGISGYNLAFIGNATRYHRPEDSLQNMSMASMQDQGRHALALARNLAGGPEVASGRQDAVFFDVFGHFLVRWPASVTPILLLLLLAALVGCGWQLARRQAISMRSAARASLDFFLWLVLPQLVSFCLVYLFTRFAGAGSGQVAHPIPFVLAFTALGVLVASVAAARILRRSHVATFLLVNWGVYLLASLFLHSSGAVFLFLVPAITGACALLFALWAGRGQDSFLEEALVVPFLAMLILWLPLARILYDGLGWTALSLIAVQCSLAVVLLLLWLPARMQQIISVTSMVTVIVAVAAALLVPKPSAAVLTPVNLLQLEDADSGVTRWALAGNTSQSALSPILRSSQMKFQSGQAFPWWPGAMPVAPAPAANLAAPLLAGFKATRTENGLELSGHLRSARGAGEVALLFPPQSRIVSARIGGVVLPTPPSAAGGRSRNWRRFTVVAPGAGADVSITVDPRTVDEFYIADQSFGLPSSGQAALLAGARRRRGSAFQDGDVSIVSHRVQLQ